MAEPIRTNAGWAGFGDNYYRGYSVRDELFSNEPLWSALSLAVGWRRLSTDECRYLDALSSCLLVPDPRIWHPKLVWLVGSYGSPLLAMSAWLAFVEGTLGPGSIESACSLWREAARLIPRDDAPVDLAAWLDDLSGREEPGLGVPGRTEDERVALVRRASERHARVSGLYYRAFVTVDDGLQRRAGRRVNVTGALAACLLDLGFTPAQVRLVAVHALAVPLWSGATDSAGQTPEQLRALPVEAVVYAGEAARLSTRAANAVDRSFERAPKGSHVRST